MKIINYKLGFLLFGLVLLFACLKEETSFEPAPPAAVYFADANWEKNKVAGKIVVERAGDEENVSEYVLWWGKEAGDPHPGLGQIAVLPKTGARLTTYEFSGDIPENAAYILACGRNEHGTSASSRSTLIMDALGVESSSDAGVKIFDLAVSDTNKVYVAGSAAGAISFGKPLEHAPLNTITPGHNVFTAKFDDQLNPVWLEYKSGNDSTEDYGRGVAAKTDDAVYVFGQTKGDMFSSRERLDKPRPSNMFGGSDLFWFGYQKNDGGSYSEKTRTLCYPASGGGRNCGEYVVGTQFGTPGDDFVPAPLNGVNPAALLMNKGILYMAGNYKASETAEDILIGLYDTQDNMFYQRTLRSDENNAADLVHDMAVSDEGDVYIVGETRGGSLGLDPEGDGSFYAGKNAFLMRFPKTLLGHSSSLCGENALRDEVYDATAETVTIGDKTYIVVTDNKTCDGQDNFPDSADISEDAATTAQMVDHNKLALPLDDRNYHWLCSKNGGLYAGDPLDCVIDAMSESGIEYTYEKHAIGWNRQIGTNGAEAATAVAVDGAGDVYVAGYTDGDLSDASRTSSPSGTRDVFIFKITDRADAQGKRNARIAWQKQIRGEGDETPTDMAVDGDNNLYLLISTKSSVFAKYSGSGFDAVLVKYSPAGQKVWGKQLGIGSQNYCAYSLDLDSGGNVYIGGFSCDSDNAKSFIVKMGK